MLQHMVDMHKGVDFQVGDVRQIDKAITIERISKDGEILNTKSEQD